VGGGGGMQGKKGKFGLAAQPLLHIYCSFFQGIRKPPVQYFLMFDVCDFTLRDLFGT
jgi:hypothetical protein